MLVGESNDYNLTEADVRSFGRRAVATWVLTGMVGLAAMTAGAAPPESPFAKRIPAGELPDGLPWINTSKPLTFGSLRGRFVLLDFWTYGCINCMHLIPALQKLEATYPTQLLVIGVHSPKFENEQDLAKVREAVARYDLTHPIVNDVGFVIWKRFGVSVWPTLLLIDPEGYLVWAGRGEQTFEQLDRVLKPAVAYYRSKGLLDERPLPIDRPAPPAATPLRYPGKVLADAESGRLFVADSNHHRIVIATLEGKLVETVGRGEAGAADGPFDECRFFRPQGLALWNNALYVADTENHLIRKIDLAGKSVSTVAGTGRQGRELPPPGKTARPLGTAISSPWDLLVHDKQLYIAMAGPHQIWRMSLAEPGIAPYAGNAREDIVDGVLLPKRWYEEGSSSFAQPSGLASDGTWLYVADAEGSSIRGVPFDRTKSVKTVVGTAHLPKARLFTFGDIDGDARSARLQHPLGVAWADKQLYVADTYNSKLKVVDSSSGATRTLAVTGLNEPSGLSIAGGKLYVADTNNHQIKTVDLKTMAVAVLEIVGLSAPAASASH